MSWRLRTLTLLALVTGGLAANGLPVAGAQGTELSVSITCHTDAVTTCDVSWDGIIGAEAYRVRLTPSGQWTQVSNQHEVALTPPSGLVSGTARVEAFSRGATLAAENYDWVAPMNTTTTSSTSTTSSTTSSTTTTTLVAPVDRTAQQRGESIGDAVHDNLLEYGWAAIIGASFLVLFTICAIRAGLARVHRESKV